MFLANTLIKGLIKVIADVDPSQFLPCDPPPPRRPVNFAEAHENDEEKQFRRVFKQLAGDDMEVSPKELMDILNKVIGKHGNFPNAQFSIECCRSMVAVMDSDSTGKLGFHEFKYLWNNIKKWQGVYKKYAPSGILSADQFPQTFKAAGFPLNEDLLKLIKRRYCDEGGKMDFDNFISCIVRLDAMCRAFKTLAKGSGNINLDVKEWLQLTMYS